MIKLPMQIAPLQGVHAWIGLAFKDICMMHRKLLLRLRPGGKVDASMVMGTGLLWG
ncbi:hypothetical protein NAS141_10381 [Sulfitobacter sp. NAS-14.1]|nr:hypothetical protein NAS141_10381 [Sulfitobacter sp. NAS-14.1]